MNVPFTATRSVLWGECDPSGFIYTPRALDYSTELIHAFTLALTGQTDGQNIKEGWGMPMVRVECDYIKALLVDQDVVLTLTVERLGSASVTYNIDAKGPDGTEYFRVRQISCAITLDPVKAIPIPEGLRARIEAYQSACAAVAT
jgi:acyl-CoA thioesterase FadM